jgi:hypothetical protein
MRDKQGQVKDKARLWGTEQTSSRLIRSKPAFVCLLLQPYRFQADKTLSKSRRYQKNKNKYEIPRKLRSILNSELDLWSPHVCFFSQYWLYLTNEVFCEGY